MPCDSQPFRKGQTLTERKTQVVDAVTNLSRQLAAGSVKPKIGPQGAIVFDGWNADDRAGVTDACAYRRLMVTGSALAKAAIQKAEMVAGRKVDMQAVGAGHHSHDGGETWSTHRHHH